MSLRGPLLCPILVGRDDLLELAGRRIDEAAAGSGQFLLVAGEAGVGKSRFLGAIRATARASGFDSANGSVAPQDRFVPASLILDLARSMSQVPTFAELGRALLPIASTRDDSEPRTRRLLVRDAVDRIIDGIAQPAMLEFEDLQWADELSLEILAELARRIRDRPILIVATYRTDELPGGSFLRAWRARLVAQRLVEETRLRPLTLDETGLMTTMILATGLPAPRDVVSAVHERTDGIPLHVEELLGALAGAARADGRAIRDATVPATIEDAILARVAHLSDEGRAVARAGAVIGRCFVPEVLAGIMDWPLEDLDEPLRELTERSFLDPRMSDGYVDFRHQLLRDAIYGSIPARDLRRLHARAAEFGAQLQGASEIHASVHYERAGLRSQAYQAAMAGARAASRLSARGEAYELYLRAINNMPADLPPGDQGELFEAFSDAAGAIEENQRSRDAALIARTRYLEAGRVVSAAGLFVTLASLARREAEPTARRLELLRQGLAELATVAPSPEVETVRSWLLGLRSMCELDAMDITAARATAMEARAAAEASGDPAGILDAVAQFGEIDVLSGALEEGMAVLRKAAGDARDAGFEEVGVMAYRHAAMLAVRVQDYRSAEACISDGVRYAEAVEQSHCRRLMGASSAMVAWAAGRWDEAEERGRQELVEASCNRAALIAHDALGYVALGRGDLDAARTELETSLAAGEKSGEIDLVLPALWGLAEADLIDDRPEAAATRCAEGLRLARASGERARLVPFVVTGVRACLAAGRPDLAEDWLEDVGSWLAGPWSSLAEPAIEHGRALVRLSAGSTAAARTGFEAAHAGWLRRGRAWEAAWAQLDLAGCLMRLGRYAEASSHMAAVRETADRLASLPLVARADELSQRARGRTAEPEPWRPLTTREYEVARLVADGMTNAEIADQLSIAPKTASAHIEHILAKLGVARRAEIAAWVATIARAQRAPTASGSPSTSGALALDARG